MKEWKKGRSLGMSWWGRQLKEIMEIRKITEEDLAKSTGLKQSNLHRIIEGKYSPSFEIMENIVKELGFVITIELPF